LIITEDGDAAINMEHSSFDGHTLIRYAGDIYDYSCAVALSAPKHVSPLNAKANLPTYNESTQTLKALNVSRLNWNLTADLRASLAAAELRFNSFALQCDTKTVNFREYGQTHITSKMQMSPDALVQMAFQIAPVIFVVYNLRYNYAPQLQTPGSKSKSSTYNNSISILQNFKTT